jgi:hypothetical protein
MKTSSTSIIQQENSSVEVGQGGGKIRRCRRFSTTPLLIDQGNHSHGESFRPFGSEALPETLFFPAAVLSIARHLMRRRTLPSWMRPR